MTSCSQETQTSQVHPQVTHNRQPNFELFDRNPKAKLLNLSFFLVFQGLEYRTIMHWLGQFKSALKRNCFRKKNIADISLLPQDTITQHKKTDNNGRGILFKTDTADTLGQGSPPVGQPGGGVCNLKEYQFLHSLSQNGIVCVNCDLVWISQGNFLFPSFLLSLFLPSFPSSSPSAPFCALSLSASFSSPHTLSISVSLLSLLFQSSLYQHGKQGD